jgi:hypothetical protein
MVSELRGRGWSGGDRPYILFVYDRMVFVVKDMGE